MGAFVQFVGGTMRPRSSARAQRPRESRSGRRHLYKRIVFVLLYEKQKIAKWKALWDGYRDGKRGKLGERGQ